MNLSPEGEVSPDGMLDDFIQGSVTGISWNNFCNHAFLIDDRNPWLAVDAPVMDCLLLRVFIVVNVDEGHPASVKVH